MAPLFAPPFRFLDLPREIRDKIYRILLCSFASPPEDVYLSHMIERLYNFVEIGLSVETSILRTCKDVYYEAYDVMIKTNRFVHVKSTGGIPLVYMVNCREIPVVTAHVEHIKKFNGYVLDVSMGSQMRIASPVVSEGTADIYSISPVSFVILYRELDSLCKAIADCDLLVPGFRPNIALSINVGSLLTEKQTPRNNSFRDFFSEATQKDLLRPFRDNFRGLQNVKIGGAVSRDVANATREEMALAAQIDGKKLLEDTRAAKESGNTCFQNHLYEPACNIWQNTIKRIEDAHRSSAWEGITKEGGRALVSSIAEIYFVLLLNAVRGELRRMEVDGKDVRFAAIMAGSSLDRAWISLGKDYWAPNFTYKPSDALKAKLLYRNSMFCSNEGVHQEALAHIDDALQLAPNDPLLVKQKRHIIEGLFMQ